MQSFSVSMGTMLNPSEKYSKATVYYGSEQALSAFKTVKQRKNKHIHNVQKHCYISWFKLLRNNSRTMINLTNTYLIFQISIAKNFVAIHYQRNSERLYANLYSF